MINRKLVPTNRCRTWVNLKSYTELWIWVWISSANKCNIFVTLGLDCNRVDRSQNGTCNVVNKAWIKRKYTIQDYWTSVCGILSKASGKSCERGCHFVVHLKASRRHDFLGHFLRFQSFFLDFTKYLGSQMNFGFFISYLWREWFDQNLEFFFRFTITFK